MLVYLEIHRKEENLPSVLHTFICFQTSTPPSVAPAQSCDTGRTDADPKHNLQTSAQTFPKPYPKTKVKKKISLRELSAEPALSCYGLGRSEL